MPVQSVRCSCGVVFEDHLGQAYNEEAFRYLLAIERKRAQRSRRPFLLVLVNVKQQSETGGRIPPTVAGRIFSTLWRCVREVDFVGWFREGRVAGAVLTQGRDPRESDAVDRIGQRITGILRERVPSRVAPRLHVRVMQVSSGLKS